MLDTTLLTPGARCLYKRLTLAWERRAETAHGQEYHIFRTQGGAEKRLSATETARQVWIDITDHITGEA